MSQRCRASFNQTFAWQLHQLVERNSDDKNLFSRLSSRGEWKALKGEFNGEILPHILHEREEETTPFFLLPPSNAASSHP